MNTYSCLEQYLNNKNPNKTLSFTATNLNDYDKWKFKAKKKLINISGIDKLNKVNPSSELHVSIKKSNYIREYWTINTQQNVLLPFYILKPNSINNGKVIIIPSGNRFSKEEIAGEKMVYSSIISDLIDSGYIIVAPDSRGSGERSENLQQKNSLQMRKYISNIYLCFGISLIGLNIWDLIQLVDFLETRSYVDSNCIGCLGLSDAEQQIICFSALDDRIRATAINGFFYGILESLTLLSEYFSYDYPPGILNYFDIEDITSIISPKSLYINSYIYESNELKNDKIDLIKKAYSLFDAENSFKYTTQPYDNKLKSNNILSFFNKSL